jgi:hypothetical protein
VRFARGGRRKGEAESAVIEPLATLQISSKLGNEFWSENDVWGGADDPSNLRIGRNQDSQESHVSGKRSLLVQGHRVAWIINSVEVSSPDADASLLENFCQRSAEKR